MEVANRAKFDFSLLIPYYNNFQGLIRSLQSVCYDPVKYSILIVDDGSMAPLHQTELAAHLPGGPSLHIIRLPENQGITRALNAGLRWLGTKNDFRFVARLD